MPTENRSSNTDLQHLEAASAAMTQIRTMLGREQRPDQVAAALEACDWTDTPIGNKAIVLSAIKVLRALQPQAEPDSYPTCDYCGTIPDYHPWHGSGMINGVENRHIHACDGCLRKLPIHPVQRQGEAVAWMVGTAIWWSKAEAENDADLVGEPVVPLGPLAANFEVVVDESLEFQKWWHSTRCGERSAFAAASSAWEARAALGRKQ